MLYRMSWHMLVVTALAVTGCQGGRQLTGGPTSPPGCEADGSVKSPATKESGITLDRHIIRMRALDAVIGSLQKASDDLNREELSPEDREVALRCLGLSLGLLKQWREWYIDDLRRAEEAAKTSGPQRLDY